ncbi:FMN-binding negative transcriptional regulator [Thalassobaculum litoreum]|uniref:Negative transcriptional regulator, PaiB family n=1 Tax=Thalassobaculum litoreum DSM 18839 TaxID=1123362 RepID=A0A8G2BF13_9PROT|nr:FMN-binding negative transcriptional regulator [Thalassobaculum litoreum]SDF28342.1 negative transcriptional regulator, PaiB family [Thalassobaculum litoreum DSM 18839]
MYIPPAFRLEDRDAIVAVMRDNAFAVLVAHRGETVEISHLPLMVEERGADLVIRGHVARANPIVALIEAGASATAVFSGPHAYISPDWYASADQVPTWNYVAVHAGGRLQAVPAAEDTTALLADLSVEHETPLAPKRPWTHGKMRDGLMARMIKGVLAFELPVERLEAKSKMAQNKKPEDITGAVKGLRGRGDVGNIAVAQIMEG